jgi:hypothetical protein
VVPIVLLWHTSTGEDGNAKQHLPLKHIDRPALVVCDDDDDDEALKDFTPRHFASLGSSPLTCPTGWQLWPMPCPLLLRLLQPVVTSDTGGVHMASLQSCITAYLQLIHNLHTSLFCDYPTLHHMHDVWCNVFEQALVVRDEQQAVE